MSKLNRRDKKIAEFLNQTKLFRVKRFDDDIKRGWRLYHELATTRTKNGEVEYRKVLTLLPDKYILLLGYELDYNKFSLSATERETATLSLCCQLDLLYEEKVYRTVCFHKGSIYRTLEPILLERYE